MNRNFRCPPGVYVCVCGWCVCFSACARKSLRMRVDAYVLFMRVCVCVCV